MGKPANFKEINKIGKENNIAIIEDGAQSFGSTHHKLKSCGLSTIGATSFFPSKPLGVMEMGEHALLMTRNWQKILRNINTWPK